MLSPAGGEKTPLTIAEVLGARMVSYPFTVRDICLVTDGGGAIVLTAPERAKSLKKAPVYVLGCGGADTHPQNFCKPRLHLTGAPQTSPRAQAVVPGRAQGSTVMPPFY